MDMFSHWNKEGYHPSPALKAFQIFLLILIVVGIGLLITREKWVPKVVEYILSREANVDDTASMTETEKYAQAALGDPDIQAATSALIGEWQSTEDPLMVRIFKKDWQAIDEYRDKTVDRQIISWNIFTKETPDPDFKGTMEDGAVYVRIYQSQNGSSYFKIEKVTPEEFSMINLDGRKILSFKKLP